MLYLSQTFSSNEIDIWVTVESLKTSTRYQTKKILVVLPIFADSMTSFIRIYPPWTQNVN